LREEQSLDPVRSSPKRALLELAQRPDFALTTLADLSWVNLGMILAVTFLLEECIAFYLRKGGTIPAIGRKQGVAAQAKPPAAQPKQKAKAHKTNARWAGRRYRNANK
jgi:hypothetical protein